MEATGSPLQQSAELFEVRCLRLALKGAADMEVLQHIAQMHVRKGAIWGQSKCSGTRSHPGDNEKNM